MAFVTALEEMCAKVMTPVDQNILGLKQVYLVIS